MTILEVLQPLRCYDSSFRWNSLRENALSALAGFAPSGDETSTTRNLALGLAIRSVVDKLKSIQMVEISRLPTIIRSFNELIYRGRQFGSGLFGKAEAISVMWHCGLVQSGIGARLCFGCLKVHR